MSNGIEPPGAGEANSPHNSAKATNSKEMGMRKILFDKWDKEAAAGELQKTPEILTKIHLGCVLTDEPRSRRILGVEIASFSLSLSWGFMFKAHKIGFLTAPCRERPPQDCRTRRKTQPSPVCPSPLRGGAFLSGRPHLVFAWERPKKA